MESCEAVMTKGTNLHDDEANDFPKQLYKSTSCLVLTNVNSDCSSGMFRLRKRSLVDCESESDESVEKWAKVDYDSESCSEEYVTDFQHFSERQSPGCKWKSKGQVGMSYSLRPRTGLRKCWSEGDVDSPRRGTRKSNRCRAANRVTLSKYRRNTANARERERMKEINTAFSALRGVLPTFATSQMPSMTKITTLQLASSYIRALSDMLNEPVNNNEHHEDESSTDEDDFCSRRPGLHRGSKDDQFNNNTCLPNRNLQPDGPSRQQQVNLEGPGTTSTRQPSASILRPSELLVGDAGARNSSERSGDGGCDDTLLDDYLLAWGDLAPLQNFHWDSN